MPDPPRLALERALADVRAAKAPLVEAEARLVAMLAEPDDLIPLKLAAHEMGLDAKAARKRAQRGSGLLRDGRWYLPRWYVDGVKTGRMST